jgi:hypothetical protein
MPIKYFLGRSQFFRTDITWKRWRKNFFRVIERRTVEYADLLEEHMPEWADPRHEHAAERQDLLEWTFVLRADPPEGHMDVRLDPQISFAFALRIDSRISFAIINKFVGF